jgi:DNA polymerase-3 subunit gamma/tau
MQNPIAGRPTGESLKTEKETFEEEEIDLNDLIDAPPESVLSPVDRLAQAFPGAELIDDPDR